MDNFVALCIYCTGRDDFHIAVLSNVNSKYVKCFDIKRGYRQYINL